MPSEEPTPEAPAAANDEDVALPAWLRGSSLDPEVSSSPSVTEAPAEQAVAEPSETVAVASDSEESVQETSNEPDAVPSVAAIDEPVIEEPAPASVRDSASVKISDPSVADDLPDWLKGMDSAALSREVSEELSSVPSAEPVEAVTESAPEAVTEESSPASVTNDEAPSSEDLPDWLKSSIVTTGTEESKNLTSEDKVEKKPKRSAKKPSAEKSA